MDQLINMLNKLEMKLDKLDDRLNSVEKILIEQGVELKEHTRRSTAAEENMSLLREQHQEHKDEQNKELEPLKAHVSMMEGAGKLVGIVAVVIGIIGATVALFK